MKDLLKKYFVPVYEGEGESEGEGGGSDDKGTDDKTEKTYSQTEVNNLLAVEKRKNQKKVQDQISQLEDLKKVKNVSSEETERLNSQIDTLNNELLSKDDLTKKEKEKESRKHTKELEVRDSEINTWKDRFTSSTIERSLVDASIEHDSFNPEQIVAILRPNTQLVAEEVDGEKTGNLIPRTKMTIKDDDGKDEEVIISPSDAVKNMIDMEKYGNLFKSNVKSGLGQKTDAGKKDTGDILDTDKFMAARRKNREARAS